MSDSRRIVAMLRTLVVRAVLDSMNVSRTERKINTAFSIAYRLSFGSSVSTCACPRFVHSRQTMLTEPLLSFCSYQETSGMSWKRVYRPTLSTRLSPDGLFCAVTMQGPSSTCRTSTLVGRPSQRHSRTVGPQKKPSFRQPWPCWAS